MRWPSMYPALSGWRLRSPNSHWPSNPGQAAAIHVQRSLNATAPARLRLSPLSRLWPANDGYDEGAHAGQ
jgi:hypothetical protein